MRGEVNRVGTIHDTYKLEAKAELERVERERDNATAQRVDLQKSYALLRDKQHATEERVKELEEENVRMAASMKQEMEAKLEEQEESARRLTESTLEQQQELYEQFDRMRQETDEARMDRNRVDEKYENYRRESRHQAEHLV